MFQAVLMEVQRFANIVPFGIIHLCTRDVAVNGMTIPAGTFIQGLNAEILKGNYWNDGENFRPERFLGKDGKTVKEDCFIPFSMGRRKCLGETLAKTEMFLFFTNLLQHYHFLPEVKGEIPSADFSPGLTILPVPFKSRLVCRF